MGHSNNRIDPRACTWFPEPLFHHYAIADSQSMTRIRSQAYEEAGFLLNGRFRHLPQETQSGRPEFFWLVDTSDRIPILNLRLFQSNLKQVANATPEVIDHFIAKKKAGTLTSVVVQELLNDFKSKSNDSDEIGSDEIGSDDIGSDESDSDADNGGDDDDGENSGDDGGGDGGDPTVPNKYMKRLFRLHSLPNLISILSVRRVVHTLIKRHTRSEKKPLKILFLLSGDREDILQWIPMAHIYLLIFPKNCLK
jgi:hypothetical protein